MVVDILISLIVAITSQFTCIIKRRHHTLKYMIFICELQLNKDGAKFWLF